MQHQLPCEGISLLPFGLPGLVWPSGPSSPLEVAVDLIPYVGMVIPVQSGGLRRCPLREARGS